jgi:hypothetical protein
MTLQEAKIHIQYIKTKQPDFFTKFGVTEEDLNDESLISQAATIATEAHWGADNVSEEELFNKTLARLVENK